MFRRLQLWRRKDLIAPLSSTPPKLTLSYRKCRVLSIHYSGVQTGGGLPRLRRDGSPPRAGAARERPGLPPACPTPLPARPTAPARRVPPLAHPFTCLFFLQRWVLLIKIISRASSERDESRRCGSLIKEGVAVFRGGREEVRGGRRRPEQAGVR